MKLRQRIRSILSRLGPTVRWRPDCRLDTSLIVTVDVEADSDKNWGTPDVRTFRNVLEAVPNRLHPLFAQYGVRPTYLVSPEVLQHNDCRAVLRNLSRCELGAHLHVEDVPPESIAVGPTRPRRGMQWECAPEIERQKLQNLTQLFCNAFGKAPRSFRAGRFGIGHHTGKFLMELGYVVDSSVTPHVRWSWQEGAPIPDFTQAEELPYWVADDGDIFKNGGFGLLEVPVTILSAREGPSSRGSKPIWFRPWHTSRDLLRQVVRALACAPPSRREPIWFRPWYTSGDLLQQVVRALACASPSQGVRRPLVMMFHSVEVMAGASPYPQTEAEVEKYLSVLGAVFDTVADCGIKSCTLSEYREKFLSVRNPGSS